MRGGRRLLAASACLALVACTPGNESPDYEDGPQPLPLLVYSDEHLAAAVDAVIESSEGERIGIVSVGPRADRSGIWVELEAPGVPPTVRRALEAHAELPRDAITYIPDVEALVDLPHRG
ncbi:hypothetical protein RDV89_08525 [Nocardioides zeae]|uniref:Uncharacterized protein n=1 Tax=Nocardioides imazamoxiresistens TaxID=3231893 RepID=A0ABU3PV49_9ACTN|nr:hypothetical protein [Nocardioides zeae]MDT9593110.1 hypothetical protein [Nocardioides zeae]